MDGGVLLSFAVFLVLSGIYVAFVVHRVRVHRGRRRATRTARTESAAATEEERLARALERAAEIAGHPPAPLPADAEPPPAPVAPAADVPPTGPAASPAPEPPAAPPVRQPDTVAELLAGIVLPLELAPLTTMASRDVARDRVAFWAREGDARDARAAFLRELDRLGFRVAELEPNLLALDRDGERGLVQITPDAHAAKVDRDRAYPSVPDGAFVIEVWLPL